MTAAEVERALNRVGTDRPELRWAVQAVADGLTAGQGVGMIHQAGVQHYLWWHVPGAFPRPEWTALVEATAALLEELGLTPLARLAGSETTDKVLGAWAAGEREGVAAYRTALAGSGVDPPDTDLLAWGSVMGPDEAAAHEAVERALGQAVATGQLVPRAARWQAKAAAITQTVLSEPLDLPPGQTLAGLVTTERLGTWIAGARHPVHQRWRSDVARRLLHPIEPPPDPSEAVAPMVWLLDLAARPGGAELTQSFYLARASVQAAVDRFDWWPWDKAPRSEADVPELSTLRDAGNRLRLVRRRGRRLHVTARGGELLAAPDRLWAEVAGETEDGSDFARMVTELVGLRLLRGRVTPNELVAEIVAPLVAQGWATGGGLVSAGDVSFAAWGPLRWWRLFGALDEEEARWEHGTGRQLSQHTVALTAGGERMVLAYLRSRSTGPRHRLLA